MHIVEGLDVITVLNVIKLIFVTGYTQIYENYVTELPLEGLFCGPIQKRACLITVLDRLKTSVQYKYR